MNKRLAQIGAVLLLLPAAALAQSTLRFGVLGLFHPRTLEVTWTGPGALVVSGAGDPIVLNGEEGHRRVVMRAAAGRVLLRGRSAVKIAVAARDGGPGGFELTVPGRFHRMYEGQLEISSTGGELVPVVSMNLETAVATIVASEMPAGTPLEALKAQAVVARSFLSGGPRHRDFDFCDTTHCQYMRSPTEVSRRVWDAVRATQALILMWRQRPIAALYSSRCGGRTRSLQQAGIDPGEGYPYYSVECRWCREHPMRGEPGAKRVPANTSGSRIAGHREWGWSDGRGGGSDSADAGDIRGIGHGIGLCQYGAAGMAQEGADFRSILAHYYPNAEVGELPGPHAP